MSEQSVIAGEIRPARSHNHEWDHENEKRLAACEFKDGNARTEKTCRHCGMVKITIHYPVGFPGREWRTKDGKRWWGQATPPCNQKVRP